eukprot:UN12388
MIKVWFLLFPFLIFSTLQYLPHPPAGCTAENCKYNDSSDSIECINGIITCNETQTWNLQTATIMFKNSHISNIRIHIRCNGLFQIINSTWLNAQLHFI